MPITRRDATKLVIAGPALASTALPVEARSNRAWAKRLEKDLNARIKPGCDGYFKVIGFGQGVQQNGDTAFVAGVELHWPPGFRRRKFNAAATTEEGAYQLLLATTLHPFRKAWTYPDGRMCIA